MFTVSNVDLTSLGAPLNTSLSASFAGADDTEVPISGGVANVTLTVPADAADPLEVQLTAQPTGTQVTVPLRVGAVDDTDPGTGLPESGDAGASDGDSGTGTGTTGRGDGDLAVTGTDAGWMGAGVLAALALLGLGVVLRRRSVRQAD